MLPGAVNTLMVLVCLCIISGEELGEPVDFPDEVLKAYEVGWGSSFTRHS